MSKIYNGIERDTNLAHENGYLLQTNVYGGIDLVKRRKFFSERERKGQSESLRGNKEPSEVSVNNWIPKAMEHTPND